MEYTATSYAEPLQRVFDDTLAPERDVDITHDAGVRVPHRGGPTTGSASPTGSRTGSTDRSSPRSAGSVRLRAALAPGVMHRYLAYMLTALIAVLVAGVIREPGRGCRAARCSLARRCAAA